VLKIKTPPCVGFPAAEFFGEVGMFLQSTRMADVVTETQARLLRLSSNAFQLLIKEAPELAGPLLFCLPSRWHGTWPRTIAALARTGPRTYVALSDGVFLGQSPDTLWFSPCGKRGLPGCSSEHPVDVIRPLRATALWRGSLRLSAGLIRAKTGGGGGS